MRSIRLTLCSAAAQIALCTAVCAQTATTSTASSPPEVAPGATIRPVDLTASVDRLWNLLHRRAALAVDAAKWKWNAKVRILDQAREQKLLDDMAAAASARGLDPLFVVDVFRAQLEVSRTIQSNLFARWKAEGVVKHMNAVDLRSTLRPALDQVGKEILDVLAPLNTLRGTSQLRDAVERRLVNAADDSIWTPGIERAAFAPLLTRTAPARNVRMGRGTKTKVGATKDSKDTK